MVVYLVAADKSDGASAHRPLATASPPRGQARSPAAWPPQRSRAAHGAPCTRAKRQHTDDCRADALHCCLRPSSSATRLSQRAPTAQAAGDHARDRAALRHRTRRRERDAPAQRFGPSAGPHGGSAGGGQRLRHEHTGKILTAWRLCHPAASPSQRLPAPAGRQTVRLGVSAPLAAPLPRSARPPSPGPDRRLGPWPGDGPR
jgi:hypothetical protein